MRRGALLLGAWLIWGAAACGGAAVDPAAQEDDDSEDAGTVELDEPKGFEIRVATWNVRRFFDTVCDSGNCEGDDFEALPDEAAFEARADEIAEAIRAFEADVVLLQEIESQACMDALEARLGDLFDVFILGETRLAGSVDTAVLARGRHVETITHRQEPLALPDGSVTRFSREFLEVHLSIESRPVVVFSSHFKSKNNDDPQHRLAEAVGAREIVLSTADAERDALIVMGGDLNDTPESAPLQALMDGGRLVRVAEELGPDSWTHVFRGNIVAIDHLMLVNGRGGHVPDSSLILRDGAGFGGSDHYPLMSTFTLE